MITIPIGTIIFGPLLRPIIKIFAKIDIKFQRAFWVQFCAFTAGWFSIIVSVFIGLAGVTRDILLTMNLFLSTVVMALIYSKLIKNEEHNSIGMKKGLFVSTTVVGVAVILEIPLKLIIKMIA